MFRKTRFGLSLDIYYLIGGFVFFPFCDVNTAISHLQKPLTLDFFTGTKPWKYYRIVTDEKDWATKKTA